MTEENKDLTLKDKVDFLFEKDEQNIKSKSKSLKIPKNAKVSKGKLKKGYIGILKIDENRIISGEKQKIEESTIRLKDGTYHGLDGSELLLWGGKFPVVIQQVWKQNPLKLIKDAGEKNETYGQKVIMARMLKDMIKIKNTKGQWLIWVIIGIVILFALSKLGIFKAFGIGG